MSVFVYLFLVIRHFCGSFLSLQGSFVLFKVAEIIREPSEIKPVRQGSSGDFVLLFNSSFCHCNLLIIVVEQCLVHGY